MMMIKMCFFPLCLGEVKFSQMPWCINLDFQCLVIGRGPCRWKNTKLGYPYLIPTKKLIHWMSVDDPKLGSLRWPQVPLSLCEESIWSIVPTAFPPCPPAHLVRPKQGKLKSRRPAQAGLSRRPLRCCPDSCRGSDPAWCPHHQPHPTPVGEVSFGEKAGAALISFREIRMDLFTSILPALLSPNAQWTILYLYSER